MDQDEINANNHMILSEFLKAIADRELVAAVVTLRTDGRGIGWYPVAEVKGDQLLELLRKKPDKVVVEPTHRRPER